MRYEIQRVAVGFVVAVSAMAVFANESSTESPKHAAGAARGGLLGTDANGDGQITYDEVKAKAPNFTQERFAKRDANGDGVLDAEELKAIRQDVAQQIG